MPRLKFKKKCGICKKEWVVITYREFPICTPCHLQQIFGEEISDKDFQFLNIDKAFYEQSGFLRSIRQSYLMYKTLSDKQIAAFKKVVRELQGKK